MKPKMRTFQFSCMYVRTYTKQTSTDNRAIDYTRLVTLGEVFVIKTCLAGQNLRKQAVEKYIMYVKRALP